VCCRNLLIYLTPELQKKLLRLFHYGLNQARFCFGERGDCWQLYRLVWVAGWKNSVVPAVGFCPDYAAGVPDNPCRRQARRAVQAVGTKGGLQTLADQLLLQKYSPAAALTNDKGDILYISGRTGKHLEPAAGKANWNIFAMAREGLRYELMNAFKKALRQKETVTLKNVLVGTDGGKHVVMSPSNLSKGQTPCTER